MKKATLSELMDFGAVQLLNCTRQQTLKGGCGDDKYPKYCKYDEDKEDDGQTSGGPNDFIPPPGT
ncbi:MAG: hypothetical protein R3E32_11855 [Chitinophagales bacterium]